MNTKIFSFIVMSLILGFSSCNTDDDLIQLKKENFSGYVQKGPFLSGSSVAISELDNGLNQTGRSYFTTVSGNSGIFAQKQIELISNFVQLKADGYYFNEVSGQSSPGPLTLYALADVSQINSANVNVLTHLEKGRVEYLVQEQGLSFGAAKTQAQQEVLAIFNLELPDNNTSETLNLTHNGILLAISSILQGHLPTADMAELMAGIIADIRTDGTLDDPSLGSQLIDNARYINSSGIRENLETKYAEPNMGDVIIPEFESFMQQFMDETTYEPKTFITYPETGDYGINILAEGVTTIKAISPFPTGYFNYSMKAETPKGASLKIIIKGGMWSRSGVPIPENWTIGQYDITAKMQVFTVKEGGTPSDLQIFVEPGEITIEYYENGAIEPTRTKQVVAELQSQP